MRALHKAVLLMAAPVGMAAAQGRALSSALQPYAACKLPSGPELRDVTPLVKAQTKRTVQTGRGDRQVQLRDGARLSFAYGSVDFATVKVEELSAASYAQGRADLLANLEFIRVDSAVFDENPNLPMLPRGYEAHGIDRKDFDGGGVLGVYLLFDDVTHVVTTVHFLNAEPAKRKFKDVVEYRASRDRFLLALAGCVGTRS